MVIEAEFNKRLIRHAQQMQELLDSLLATERNDGEIMRPRRLVEAMRHAVLNGGKRLRPALLIESAELFGADRTGALFAGAALECVHCYSLVHDDLPAMDDDDMRRGQPTVHRAFDEATAILAGDSLLTLAFELLADHRTHGDPAVRAELVAMLARAAGLGGMAGGQMLDLQGEHGDMDADGIAMMQSMKTGALFRFACEAGAVLGGANDRERRALARFGAGMGAMFQLADDILDVTATAGALGKRTAKDANRGKATHVSREGLENARETVARMLTETIAELAPIEGNTGMLESLARFAVARRN